MDLFKGLLIFGAGIAVGSVATYFVVKETIQQQAEAETEAFYEFYKSKMEKIPRKENSEKVDDSEEQKDDKKDSSLYEEYSSIADSYTKKEKEYTNYSSYSSEDSNEDEEKTVHPDDKSEQPYLIDQYIYEEDEEYEKLELFYYCENAILVTEDNEKVDILESLGDAGSYELKTFNEPMIWVRNDLQETDYAVTRVYSSYDGMQ